MLKVESMGMDAPEFSRLLLEQLDAVDRFARSLTRTRVEADDLVQETMLRALRSRESFELKTFGIRPWLYRILHNLHLNRISREQLRPRTVESDVLDANIPPPIRVQNDVELEQAMSALQPDLRSIMTLWAVDELSYKEIAEVLDVPIGTVMSRLYRARHRLRDLLADHPMAKQAADNQSPHG
jgi:RNA polymerase sigma-70 factor, ECF subfamily